MAAVSPRPVHCGVWALAPGEGAGPVSGGHLRQDVPGPVPESPGRGPASDTLISGDQSSGQVGWCRIWGDMISGFGRSHGPPSAVKHVSFSCTLPRFLVCSALRGRSLRSHPVFWASLTRLGGVT